MSTNITVRVRSLRGTEYAVQIPHNATVDGLKWQVFKNGAIPPPRQRLIFSGRELQDEETLDALGIQDESKVMLVVRNAETQATIESGDRPRPAMSVQARVPARQRPPQGQTCCIVVRLEMGALIIVFLDCLIALINLSITLAFPVLRNSMNSIPIIIINVLRIIVDSISMFGWYRKNWKMLCSYCVLQVLIMFYDFVATIVQSVMMVKHPPKIGHLQLDQRTAMSYVIGRFLMLIAEIIIWGYFVYAVFRFVKILRESAQERQNVGGVVYEHVDDEN